jgi:quercetin dioxygenase-like cupin family protein
LVSRAAFLAALLLLIPRLALADRTPAPGIDAVVAAAVRESYPRLHSCFARAATVDRARGGTVFVRITMGGGERVATARVERDELSDARARACVLEVLVGLAFRGASAAGVAQGSEILVPITFSPDPGQFGVGLDSAPSFEVSPGLVARPLLHEGSVGVRRASLTLLVLASRERAVALPRVEAEQLLFVAKGSCGAEIEGSGGRGRATLVRLSTRDALFLPAGAAASLRGESELVQVIVPAGAERRYLGAKASAASDGAAAVPRGPGERRPLPVRWAGARKIRLPGPAVGGITVVPLLHEANVRTSSAYLGILSAKAGTTAPEHAHLSEAELVYVLSGRGVAKLDGVRREFGPGDALHFESGSSHSFEASTDLEVVQVYAPAGPERRFFDAASGRPRGGSRAPLRGR